MRHLMMICILLMSAIGTKAQVGLNINSLFDRRYRDNPAASVTVIRGEMLRNYDLSSYLAITLNGMPEEAEEIERLVAKDGSNALSREVSYKQGHIYYGFYRLRNYNGIKRYLFYLNQNLHKGNKIMLIYLEGNAETETVKKMLKKK